MYAQHIYNYIKRTGDMMWSILELVLAGCLNIHAPKRFWLKGRILQCGQRPSVEVWTGVQQDRGQWRGAVEERQQVPAQLPGSAPAPRAAGPRDLQPPPWPLLPLPDQGLPGLAEHLLPHGFQLKRERYGVVVHHPPSVLPYSMKRGASLPASALRHRLSPL